MLEYYSDWKERKLERVNQTMKFTLLHVLNNVYYQSDRSVYPLSRSNLTMADCEVCTALISGVPPLTA